MKWFFKKDHKTNNGPPAYSAVDTSAQMYQEKGTMTLAESLRERTKKNIDEAEQREYSAIKKHILCEVYKASEKRKFEIMVHTDTIEKTLEILSSNRIVTLLREDPLFIGMTIQSQSMGGIRVSWQ